MTDITELAQRLATCAKEDTYPVLSPADCGVLVEALEKAQQRNTELENYAEAEAVGADKAAEDSMYWMKRCKELESRTVTVKLPKLKMLEDYLAEVAVEERKAILLGVRMEFHRALNAEGIKWEAE
ncbi:hypothetical protein WMA07_000878 [Klebsiella aerogenes]